MSYKIFIDLNHLMTLVILRKNGSRFENDRVLKIAEPKSSLHYAVKEYILNSIKFYLVKISNKKPFIKINDSKLILDLSDEEYELLMSLLDFDEWFYKNYFSLEGSLNSEITDIVYILEYLQIFTLISEKRYAELVERIKRVILSKKI